MGTPHPVQGPKWGCVLHAAWPCLPFALWMQHNWPNCLSLESLSPSTSLKCVSQIVLPRVTDAVPQGPWSMFSALPICDHSTHLAWLSFGLPAGPMLHACQIHRLARMVPSLAVLQRGLGGSLEEGSHTWVIQPGHLTSQMMAWQHVEKLPHCWVLPHLVRGHGHAWSCEAWMTFPQGMRNDLGASIRFPSGKAPDFGYASFPSSYLLLSPKGEGDTGESWLQRLWWLAEACAGQGHMLCGCRTSPAELRCCCVRPRHLGVAPEDMRHHQQDLCFVLSVQALWSVAKVHCGRQRCARVVISSTLLIC